MSKREEIMEKIYALCGGKSAGLFGRGASTLAAERLLKICGIESVFYQESGTNHAVECKNLIDNFDASKASQHKLIIYSPAFRPDHKWLQIAKDGGGLTLCEPDLSALAFGGKIFAVTGTDGKTSTTSFLTSALKNCGIDAFSAGNIGEPLCGLCADFLERGEDDNDKIAVCELSSFQCADIKNLRPDALLWTNFAADHLDWHTDMKEYFLSKFNLVKNLRSENFGKKIFVCGQDIPAYAKEYKVELPDFAKILYFDKLRQRGELETPAPFTSFVQAQNFVLVKELFLELKLDLQKLYSAAANFSLPDFRFGEKENFNGVDFFNDSKATNAHSAIAALEELSNRQNLIWIGGGKDKHCSLDELVAAIKKSAKGAVLIGQTAEALKNSLERLPLGAHICKDMQEAVNRAYALCEGKNDAAVLFSPAFSSFGMFSGYVERGKSFKNALLCLKNLK